MVQPISTWYKRKYTLSISYFKLVILGCAIAFIIFTPIFVGFTITNSSYEEENKNFMERYKNSWNVFPTKSDNEQIHDELCPKLNEVGHTYKDCKIWNKTTK